MRHGVSKGTENGENSIRTTEQLLAERAVAVAFPEQRPNGVEVIERIAGLL